MAKTQQQEPQQETKPQPQQEAKKPKKAKKKAYWLGTTYIKGAGTVAVGETVLQKHRDAWKKHTNVKIDKFITDKAPE